MIPLSVPHLNGNEWQYVKECLDTNWVSSAGNFVNLFEQSISAFCNVPYTVACMNGTAALHLSLHLLDVKRNDYVIAPNITFVASINAIKYIAADPIFIDAHPKDWQINLDLLEAFLTEQTEIDDQENLILKADRRRIRAIMPVHVLGNMCDMDRLLALAQHFSLKVLEDATEAIGSYWENKHAGTFGDIGCFSFNGNKIITTGGGGAIITHQQDLAVRAKHLSTQAKISPDEYIHNEVGYNYRLVNILAAIGKAQMEQLPEFLKKKKEINDYYRSHLTGVGDIVFQEVHNKTRPNNWLFTIRTSQMRDLLAYLQNHNIQTRPFWKPMNQLSMFQNNLFIQNENISAKLYNTSLSLPCSSGLEDQDIEIVVQTIKAFFL